jgi:DNA-binding transcriptional LysR family regulator
MDRLTGMITFVKVVEAGGFAAASRKLEVSPSTVTQQIQALEDRLNARLLNRSTRNISLTEIGKAYYERCLRIIADTDDAENIVQALNTTPRGVLRLNVTLAIPVFLAPVIAEFTSLYPDVKLHMTMTDRMADLIEEGIDLAITTLPIPDSSLVMRRVGSYRLLVCGSQSYFAAHGMPREPRDLMNHNCLRYTFSAWGSDWHFAAADGQGTVQVAGNMEANSINALRLAAVLGQGLILMPDFLVRDEIESGKLVPALTKFCLPARPINAVHRHRHPLSASLRSFLDLMTQRFHKADEKQEAVIRRPCQRQIHRTGLGYPRVRSHEWLSCRLVKRSRLFRYRSRLGCSCPLNVATH